MNEELKALLASKDINALCRLCLTDKCTVLDMLDPDTTFQVQNPSPVAKIFESTSIRIYQDDKLPTKVCLDCYSQVEKMHVFKQKCLASNSLLQEYRRLHHGTEVLKPTSLQNHSVHTVTDLNIHSNERTDSESNAILELTQGYHVSGKQVEYNPEILKVEIKEEEVVTESSESNDEAPNGCSAKIFKSSKKKLRSVGKEKRLQKRSAFTCNVCSKSFCNKFSLSRHGWSHSKKKPFFCNFCDKVLTNHESFLRHERMHTQGNRHKCNVCDKSYVSSTSYAAHIRKHTGERPFKCSECDETFYLLSSYERHVAKHRGVKDFVCEICAASFWVPDDLRAHVNRMH